MGVPLLPEGGIASFLSLLTKCSFGLPARECLCMTLLVVCVAYKPAGKVLGLAGQARPHCGHWFVLLG